jgi:hypothetical protein
MSNVQTRDAKRLLGIIGQAVTNGELLTYWDAALAMNRIPAAGSCSNRSADV